MSCRSSKCEAACSRLSVGSRKGQRGAVAVWLAVILVPVLLGLLGFALDLGMLYSARGELKTAASAMALASAQN